MRLNTLFRPGAPWPWLLLAAVLLLLGLVLWLSVRLAFNSHLALARQTAEHELQLISAIVTRELRAGQYQEIEPLLRKWAEANTTIAQLQLIAANGFVLARYQRPEPAGHAEVLEQAVHYSYRGEALLRLQIDHTEVYRDQYRLAAGLAAVLAVLAVLLAMLLRITLRRYHETEQLRLRTHELEESERRFRVTLENVQLLAVSLDTDGIINFCNDFLLARSGWRREEAIGRDWFAMFLPESARDAVGKMFREAIASGDMPLHFENEIVTRAGERRLVLWNNTLLRSPDGMITGTVSVGEDITDRRRAEQGLKNSEQRLRDLIDGLGPQIFVGMTTPDGVLIEANRPALVAAGLKPEDVLGMPFEETFWWNYSEEIKQQLRVAIARAAQGEATRYDVQIRVAENQFIIIDFTIQPLRDETGQVVFLVPSGNVITERKHAEDLLRASEEHLRTIIDTEPECIKLLSSDGRLIDMNAAGLAMIEADSLDQVVGKSMPGLLLPEHRVAFIALTQSVFQGNKGKLVFEIQGLKGTHRWLETHAVPMTTRTGETVLLGITRDITERKSAEDRLSYLAQHDELTGLPNRTLFNDRLNQAMIDSERHGRLLAVVFLDLDRFKNINDTLGHEAGDLLLQGVAGRLLEAVRRGDTVARLSGDEFTIVLADMAHVDDATRVAQKILDAFARPLRVAGRDLFVSVSLGVTLYPLDTSDAQELLRNADIAMYRAKEHGRNNFQFYAAEMTTKALEYMHIEGELRHAIEQDEFTLHYQPIVGGQDGRVIAVEALIRWQSGKRGLVPPLQFIPVAEETGLIVPIGEWVLRTACTQLARWQADGRPDLRMTVNVSVRQFRSLNLATAVRATLAAASLNPTHLELEITESILAEQKNVLNAMRELDALGVQFSIDDFGTGYSSLSYLKRLPIDTLKIDRSFVTGIPGNKDDAAIAQAIIAMAHSLGLNVVAEGVETSEQSRFLHSHGCDAMQGYLFSRPLPAEEMTLLLAVGSLLPATR